MRSQCDLQSSTIAPSAALPGKLFAHVVLSCDTGPIKLLCALVAQGQQANPDCTPKLHSNSFHPHSLHSYSYTNEGRVHPMSAWGCAVRHMRRAVHPLLWAYLCAGVLLAAAGVGKYDPCNTPGLATRVCSAMAVLICVTTLTLSLPKVPAGRCACSAQTADSMKAVLLARSVNRACTSPSSRTDI